jgi:hypothetical protein
MAELHEGGKQRLEQILFTLISHYFRQFIA